MDALHPHRASNEQSLETTSEVPRAREVAAARPIAEVASLVLAVGAVAAVAIVFQSTTLTFMVTLLAALSGATAVIRRHQARRVALREVIDESEAEIQEWQNRWQMLQQEAHQTTTALSRMRDGVIMLGQESEILLINPAARHLLRLSSEANLFERIFSEVVRIPDVTRAVSLARRGDGPQKVLIEISQGDKVRPIRIRVDRFSAAGDNNLLMTLRDETEAHEIEAMRREFVANISHELKTPLAAIKGYAETVELAVKDDPDAAGYFMNQIQTQCLRLERLIADMMQLARAQSGRGHMQIQPLDLPRVIADCLVAYHPVAEAKRIELTVHSPEQDAIVRSDPEATLTIANNLIGNAIHYTPDGGRVDISFRAEEKYWALVVEDTGVGIARSEQKKIFERFYRVDKNRSSAEDGGTGIGLSIVKNLTSALGGEIRVESEPGRGATFEVRLPRAPQR